MKIKYQEINFRPDSLELIEKVNQIIAEYKHMGYDLTLRQLYYQLVARSIIPNNDRSYKNVGSLVSNGRMAGLIDWDAIIDRTRNLEKNNHWNSPKEIVRACADQFQFDKWDGQECYVEVWVEKDALKGVIEKTCRKLDIPWFSCRGYTSQSEMWEASRRLARYRDYGRIPVVIHLGDHDPSGKDMSRDIVNRLDIFGANPIFQRIALNIDQVEEFNLPPNPTKLTDSRATHYIEEFGHECWELDALRPDVLDRLITNAVNEYVDHNLFEEMKEKELNTRRILSKVSDDWDILEGKYMSELGMHDDEE